MEGNTHDVSDSTEDECESVAWIDCFAHEEKILR